MKHPQRLPLFLVALTASGALLLTGCATDHSSTAHNTDTASIPATLPAGWNAQDILFAQMMIPHHQQAVDAANVVLANPAVSDRLKTHAQEVLATQQSEIDLMNTWIDKAGAIPTEATDSHAGHEGHGMDSMNNDVLASITDPTELDAEWARQMIPHHEGALVMAEDVLATTQNTEVKELASAIIATQQDEINMLNGWLTPASE